MALLSGNKVIVLEKKDKDVFIQKGFGEKTEGKLVLSLIEAAYLLEKGKLALEDGKGKALKEKDLLGKAKDKNFFNQLCVYRDLRDRGFVVKTGFKFGFDFRVYPRGKKPGQEHTQWVINVSPQEMKCSFPEFSRMVRMAGGLRTTFLQAVVDSECQVNYYEIKRITP
jgi:tRNA-intron endonuclease